MLIFPSRGEFTIQSVNAANNEISAESHGHNTVVYEGIDILAKLLAGQSLEINTMYLEFQNGGTTPTVVVDPSEGRSYYAALDAGLSTRDYIRVPLTADPVLSTTDSTKFVSNRATFLAMSTGVIEGEGGKPFSAAAVSKVYGVALVAAASTSDPSQDLVFSRSYDLTPVTKRVNEEISISWPHTFDEDMLSSSS